MTQSPTSDTSAAPVADVTDLLLAWSGGDRSAGDRLMPAIYVELRRQAARAMRREHTDHTLQATALVHEAYMRLVDQRRTQWKNRAHFFGVAAQVMRRILVDHARARLTNKRGGRVSDLSLGHADTPSTSPTSSTEDARLNVIALHDALGRLAALDADQARLVELRYFGGLDIAETAEVLGISPATVKREWATARAWLRRELEPS